MFYSFCAKINVSYICTNYNYTLLWYEIKAKNIKKFMDVYIYGYWKQKFCIHSS